MESKNDNPALYENYSNKTASARLDFWALFADVSGDVQYRRLDNLTQTKSGFETVPLNGVLNVTDSSWGKDYNKLTGTIASPYMIIKTATGDFNHDGFENEVAMLTVDKKGINLCVYQINYEDNNFAINILSDLGRIYSFSYPDYFTKWSYNGWNRMPGAEILAGDFDGDSQTELGVIFQGDIASSKRDLT